MGDVEENGTAVGPRRKVDPLCPRLLSSQEDDDTAVQKFRAFFIFAGRPAPALRLAHVTLSLERKQLAVG
jgi:hypothetical protein